MTASRHVGRGRKPGTPARSPYTLDAARTTGSVTLFIACRIARAFPSRCPSVAELQQLTGMSRATAARWARSWRDAHGVSA